MGTRHSLTLSAYLHIPARLDEQARQRGDFRLAHMPEVSRETAVKGRLATGQYAGLALLAQAPLTAPESELLLMEADLTLLAGKAVHASAAFRDLAPAPLPASPDWSPVGVYGGAWRPDHAALRPTRRARR